MMEDTPKGRDQYVTDSGQETILDIYLKSAKIPKLVVGLAAPGTGKTTTIVRLITKLLSSPAQTPIKNCLILTFTRRTRQDILNKFTNKGMIDKYPQLKRIIRNFHSLAFTTLLWKNVLSERKCTDKINQIAVKAGLEIELKDKWTVLELIKKIRMSLAHGTYRAQIREYEERQPICGIIMTEYIDWLEENYREYKAISFDYALTKFLSCIQNGRNPIKMDLSTIDLLIVDQFQDSNPAQMKIVQAILERNSCMRLLLLGDIDQTIYTWRGTDLFYLDDFIEKYKARDEYQSVLLQNTHRLGNKVLKLSQALINYRPNYRQFREKYYGKIMPVSLNTQHDYPTEVIQFESQFSEVRWVIQKIKSLVSKNKDIRYKDITILLRSFKNTSFFKKFKFLNQKLEKSQEGGIPFTVKSDQKNDALQQYLSWFAYFYMKKYFKMTNIKDIIKSMCKTIHVKSNHCFVKMIESYKVQGFRYARSKQDTKQGELIDIFTTVFRSIQRIILQEEKCSIFSQKFMEMANVLKESRLYPELTEPQIQQFLEIVKSIQGEMLKTRLQKDPTFSIFEELILRKVYKTKQTKNVRKQVKCQIKKQQQYCSQQQTPQTSNILDLVKRKTNKWKMIQSVFDSSEEQEQQVATCSKQQQRIEQAAIEHCKLADKVNIQTIYKAKGLEFKVVFICAMNFDFQHREFQQSPEPKVGANDADFHRLYSNINRKNMIKNQEELRVIYTALTRTSRYSFVTASQRDYYKPQECVRHPHFVFLQSNTENKRVEFSQFEDGEFKRNYNQWNQEAKNKYEKKWKDYSRKKNQ